MSEYTYDVTQYKSHPYQQTHPQHLSMIGKLFELQPKPWKTARILELGCAAGGNIIPHAFEAPEAEFVGVDLSKVQIEAGQRDVEALGLKNIQLLHRSITDISKEDGLFDYIICHGVWSWVPEEVRQSIFAVIRNNMTDQGIAYVSYNTLPGWNMVLSVREMMRYHTAHLKTPAERAQQARLLIQFLVEGLKNDNTPYANFLKSEIQIIARQEDSYILHEYLEEENHPTYFHDFIEQANRYNLSYLSDTNLADMFAYNLPEQFSKEITKINDIVRSNQYMDFIRNKRFRCTLLCHDHNKVNRQLSFEKTKDFYFTYVGKKSDNVHESMMVEGEPVSFTNGMVTLTVKSAIGKTAMWILQNQKNKPILFKELCQQTTRQLKNKNLKEVETSLLNELNFLRLSLSGLIMMHEDAGNYTNQPTAKPKVSKLAAYQASNAHYVTNQRHQIVLFNPIEHLFFKQLDGQKTFDQIIPQLADEIFSGKAALLREDGTKITEKEEIVRRLPALCETILEKFAENGLLLP